MTSATGSSGPVKDSLEYVFQDPDKIAKRAKKAYKHHAPEITNLINQMKLSKDLSYNKEDHTFTSDEQVLSLNGKISLKTKIKDRFKLFFSSNVDKKIAKIIAAKNQETPAAGSLIDPRPLELEIDHKNIQLNEARDAWGENQTALAGLKAEKHDIHLTVNSVRSVRKVLLAEIAALKEEKEVLRIEIGEINTEYEELFADSDPKQDRLNELFKMINDKTASMEQLEPLILEKTDRFTEVQNERAVLRSAKDALNSQITEKEEEIEAQVLEMENLERDLAATRGRLGFS